MSIASEPVRSEEPRSTSASPPHSELQCDWDLPAYDFQQEPNYTCSLLDHTAEEDLSELRVLCRICLKNFVQVEEVALLSRRKRRRAEPPPVLSSMTVCRACLRLDPSLLSAAPEKAKRVVRRQRAKVRDSAADEMLQQRQLQLAELTCADLPEQERRRKQQLIRNRISAQQSRNRKRQLLDKIEAANRELQQENQRLQEKVAQLTGENNYLRGQLERFTEQDSGVRTGSLALGLVALAALALVFSSPQAVETSLSQPRSLTASSLMEYREALPVSVVAPAPVSVAPVIL